ncbi:MAG: SpoIID/LytB domain-containing protein, partial [bacterium]|nr:SpoIID/LytB domain-containing protein [bacterium]
MKPGLLKITSVCLILLGFPVTLRASSDGVKVKHDGAVHTVPLETYVEGVLMGEMPSDWPLEALKAQAVAARSYVLYRKQNPRNQDYDVQSTVHDQVYQSKKVPELVHEAVLQTKGEILKSNGKILPGYFHSCCGGVTEEPSAVWGGPIEESVRVTDLSCSACPSVSWELTVPKSDLEFVLETLFLGQPLNFEGRWSLFVRERTASGRVKTFAWKNESQVLTFSAVNLRAKLGYERLKSTFLSVIEEEDSYRFEGKGFGHGVGLCQWGAKGMAEEGASYRDILSFYYPRVELSAPTQPEMEEEIS